MGNFRDIMHPLVMGQGAFSPTPQIGAPVMPGQPSVPGKLDDSNDPRSAFRSAIQDWRGLRPDYQAFTGSPMDWHTQMMDWHNQRPDHQDFMGQGMVPPHQPPTAVPGVPGAVPPQGMMQAIGKTFNQGYAANNPYKPVKPYYPMGG